MLLDRALDPDVNLPRLETLLALLVNLLKFLLLPVYIRVNVGEHLGLPVVGQLLALVLDMDLRFVPGQLLVVTRFALS